MVFKNMKVINIILLLLFAINNCSFGQQDSSFTFHIYIGDGFKNDTIDLLINSKKILDNTPVNSNPILGITNQYVRSFDSSNGFRIETVDSDKQKGMIFIKRKKRYVIEVHCKTKSYSFKWDLKNGKYLIINKDFHSDNINFNQYKSEPGFD